MLDRGRFQVRAVKTPLLDKLLEGDAPAPAQEGLGGGAEVAESWVKGDLEVGTLPAGQVAGLIYGISSARDIIDEMVS